jgi:hypothetical protein
MAWIGEEGVLVVSAAPCTAWLPFSAYLLKFDFTLLFRK